MSDLGFLSYYLGIEVRQSNESITLCQAGYARKILEKLRMGECNPCSIPMKPRTKMSKHGNGELAVDKTLYRSVIGSLRYLVNTRPDIAYSVGVMSRYMEAPTTSHLTAVKQILRYVKGTLSFGCVYKKKLSNVELVGFSDSDMAGDIDDRKSTTGVQLQVKPKLNVDNKSAIALAKNPVYHDRTIELEYVNTDKQLADILTKPLARQRFLELREKIGLRKITRWFPCRLCWDYLRTLNLSK
ncbi:hypothetical protein K2173_003365 [Erythroxylum novogranatense]|uniref:Reverse transcriptase Ty1/copia-type domain-containing protein n=1 Tax=Erythroxylum novogranatense TaxID=1862640 RepID=A0AAV8S8T6_9ROSI|nr:hypothetical protein K2173_003365 [Erythroxylum novogranatense]